MAKALGYSNPCDAIIRHRPRDHKAKLSEIMTVEDLGKHEALTSNDLETIYITEVGLHALIMRSKLKVAQDFQNWVYDILKTIRRTGCYSVPQAVPLLEYTGTNPMNLQTENDLHYSVNTSFK